MQAKLAQFFAIAVLRQLRATKYISSDVSSMIAALLLASPTVTAEPDGSYCLPGINVFRGNPFAGMQANYF